MNFNYQSLFFLQALGHLQAVFDIATRNSVLFFDVLLNLDNSAIKFVVSNVIGVHHTLKAAILVGEFLLP